MFGDWRMVLEDSDPFSSKEPLVERLMASFFVSSFTCLLAQVTRRFLALQMCCSSPNVAGERRPRHIAELLERCTHNTFKCTSWRHCCWDCWIRLARVPNRTVLIGQFISWFAAGAFICHNTIFNCVTVSLCCSWGSCAIFRHLAPPSPTDLLGGGGGLLVVGLRASFDLGLCTNLGRQPWLILLHTLKSFWCLHLFLASPRHFTSAATAVCMGGRLRSGSSGVEVRDLCWWVGEWFVNVLFWRRRPQEKWSGCAQSMPAWYTPDTCIDTPFEHRELDGHNCKCCAFGQQFVGRLWLQPGGVHVLIWWRRVFAKLSWGRAKQPSTGRQTRMCLSPRYRGLGIIWGGLNVLNCTLPEDCLQWSRRESVGSTGVLQSDCYLAENIH
jgi:hypothetical protein